MDHLDHHFLRRVVRALLDPTWVRCGSIWCDPPEQFWSYQVRELLEFASWLNYLGFKTHFIIVVVVVVGVAVIIWVVQGRWILK